MSMQNHRYVLVCSKVTLVIFIWSICWGAGNFAYGQDDYIDVYKAIQNNKPELDAEAAIKAGDLFVLAIDGLAPYLPLPITEKCKIMPAHVKFIKGTQDFPLEKTPVGFTLPAVSSYALRYNAAILENSAARKYFNCVS